MLPHIRRSGMRVKTHAGAVLAMLLLACLPASASAITFVQPAGSPYSTTSPPFVPDGGGFLGGMATGDFNGDGISDVAVVNGSGVPALRSGESVTVLLGNRSGGFTQAPGSPIGIFSGGIFNSVGPIAVGDFNGDGKLDLAVANRFLGAVSLLQNTTSWAETPPNPISPTKPTGPSGTPSPPHSRHPFGGKTTKCSRAFVHAPHGRKRKTRMRTRSAHSRSVTRRRRAERHRRHSRSHHQHNR
jgi:FG-GAP-like repeat